MTPSPLVGRTVVVTRDRTRAGELSAPLQERGARVLLAPAIRISPGPARPLDRAVRDLSSGRFAWVLFTSRSGVEAVLGRVSGRGAAGLPVPVAAVGEGTAAALRARGVEPDLVPSTFTTAALSRAMPRGSGAVLLARADIAPDGMEEALEAKGWTPVRVTAYRTAPATRLPAKVRGELAAGAVDAVTFTSASTVQGFLNASGDLLRTLPSPPRVACIGPVTAARARQAGLPVDVVARPHTIGGLVEAVVRVLAPARRRSARDHPSR